MLAPLFASWLAWIRPAPLRRVLRQSLGCDALLRASLDYSYVYIPPQELAASLLGRCKTKGTRVKGVIMSLVLHY